VSLVPLADVKAHLGITTADSGGRDAKLQMKIDAAEAWASKNLGGSGGLAASTVTQRVTGNCSYLALTTLPVTSVTSVTGADGIALSVGSLDVDLEAGLIGYAPLGIWSRFLLPWYTVVYQSGYANLAALPADIVEAVKLETQSMWETQRGEAGVVQMAVDAHNRAVRLLDNYGVPGYA